MEDGNGEFYRGFFQERPILVKKIGNYANILSYAINDIVVSLQMSNHKNVLKLLGCCLEFQIPALVYEYAGNPLLLTDILHTKRNEISSQADDHDCSLSWKIRLKLAVDISNALVYLHSAFATPIIHRNLRARNIIVCSDGVAKLLNFSLCISLPPGKSQIQDTIIGQIGYVEPEYMSSGIITEKTDVYMFGILLLELLTGERPVNVRCKSREIVDNVNDHVIKNQVFGELDPILLAEITGPEKELKLQQIQAFSEMALRCTLPANNRPDMINVAKELTHLRKSGHLLA